MKRIDTFGLVDSLGIYMGDITSIGELKDKVEKERERKARDWRLVRHMMSKDEEEIYIDKDEERRGQAEWETKARENARRVCRDQAKQTKRRIC